MDNNRQHQQYPNRNDYDSPSTKSLSGAYRSAANPRLHVVSKPYSRPTSSVFGSDVSVHHHPLAGSNSSNTSPSANLALFRPHTKQPASVTNSTRAQPPRSTLSNSNSTGSLGSLKRSGSDTQLSLLGGIKSIFSKPLAWLATPARSKRDSLSSFGHDIEASEETSPSAQPSKRIRRTSPPSTRQYGEYEPNSSKDAIGRAVTGFMLPPLPPHVSLTPRSTHPYPDVEKPLPNRTNFSRPLTSSTSMPYLDPPNGLFSSSSPLKGSGLGAKKNGPLTRSRRLELADLAAENPENVKEKGKVVERRQAGEAWSPWKEKSITQSQKSSMNARVTNTRDLALPSSSPFRLSTSRALVSGLTRSATTANLGRRADSVVSDISAGNSITRAGSARIPRASSTMRLSAALDDEDDRMSVDEERLREGSVLSWFMQDRWKGVEGPLSPASVAASKRLGSTTPAPTLPPIRKGQMVWDAEKGFVRKSELDAEVPKPVQQNEAERILFALEAMRKPTPHEANAPGLGSLPPGLIGSSSRSIRKAIAVPLATAQAEENARKQTSSLAQRRGLSSWTGEPGVSTVISPYGRRKQVDRAAKEERRERLADERQAVEAAERRSVSTVSPSGEKNRRSTSCTPIPDDRMSISDREATFSPPVSMGGVAPRRSARNKGKGKTMDVDTHQGDLELVAEEPTPKVRRSTRKTTTSIAAAPSVVEATPSKSRTTRRRKATSPPPEPQEKRQSTPPLPVPTITATAPSPGDAASLPPSRAESDGSAASSSSTYEVRVDGFSGPRERSSLRVRSEPKHRQHQGSASYNSSRATSPSGTTGGGSSGRYSARDEDLPQMEELEQAKIPLTSFASISLPLLGMGGGGPSTPSTSSPSEPPSTQPSNPTPLLASRIGGAPPSASPQAPSNTSFGTATGTLVPPKTGISRGSLNRLTPGISTRPRASSPLAANSIVAEPESPPTHKKLGATSTIASPPVSNFFTPPLPVAETPAQSAGSTTPAGKPPASAFSFAPRPTSSINDDSAPSSTTIKPPFSFGLGQPSGTPTNSAATTSNGPQSTNSGAGGIPNFFGSKPASTDNAASTTIPTPPAVKSFDFGISSKPAESLKPIPSTFSFSASASTPVAPLSTVANGDKSSSPFSFGTTNSASAPSTGTLFASSTPAQSAGGIKSTEAVEPSFSFGQTNTAPESAPAKSSFSFGGKPASETPASKPAFSFGAPSNSTSAGDKPTAESGSKPAFSFGSTSSPSSSTPPEPASDGATTAKPPFSFGGSSTPAFGTASGASGSSTVGAGTGFTFGKPAETAKDTSSTAAPAVTSLFGSPSPSLNSNGAGSSGFSFGQPASSTSTPKTNEHGTEPAKSSFGFGTSSATPASSTSTFTFGAPAAPSTNPVTSGTANGAVSSSFGAPSQTKVSSPFAFGSSSTNTGSTASAAPSNPTFSFGGAGNATPSTSAFGQTPQQQSGFSFGAPGSGSASASGAGVNSFGLSSSTNPNPFGTAPSSTTTPATPQFTFGAPSTNNVASTSTPSQSTFTFGSVAPQTPGATSANQGVFTFGAPSTTGSTTPAGPPPAAFQFGTGTSNGAAGAGAGVRFGSPIPSASPAPDGGAFSLGIAPSDVPGSPSGRKIKPLRRGAIKR